MGTVTLVKKLIKTGVKKMKKCTLIFFSETRPVVNILKSLYMSFCSVGSGFQMEKRLLECASG